MNRLYVGFKKEVKLPKGGCLLIDDEVQDIPRVRVFDPAKHSFNPLKGINPRKAREIAEVLYTVFPQGENTLTVRNGRRELLPALLEADCLDKVEGGDEVTGLIDDLLVSPVLKRVLCKPTKEFSFSANAVIIARLNRAELGDFDALVLGLFLMAHFKGQVVVPDLGFYGRDAHVGLVREDRLMAGVNSMSEVRKHERLHNALLLIKNKEGSGCLLEDAEMLARYRRLRWGTNAYNEFVDAAMT